MNWIYDDGGRNAAGFRGKAGDCVARSIAIATRLPYRHVCALLDEQAQRERPTGGWRSSARNGVFRRTCQRVLESLGWRWVPTMKIGAGCRVHLKGTELPRGRLIVRCSKHTTAVIDGIIHDTYDPSRGGTRCVYGYFTKGTGAGNVA
jgi:hypothetical protein